MVKSLRELSIRLNAQKGIKMLIVAKQNFVRTNPRKIRLVIDAIRKTVLATDALAVLDSIEKRAAKVVSKVMKQAIANSTNNFNLPISTLKVKELQVTGGPTYKRGQPVSRGRFHEIKKRTSHITIILESQDEEKKVETKAKK
jgi:large subunit ribosomal protein L22